MFAKISCSILFSGMWLLAFVTPEVERGKALFVRRCGGCHATDLNKEGPLLRGVFGREAGGVPGFGYSVALTNSTIVWTDATLDKWLSDPDAMVPNTDMAFRLADRAARKEVIAYLKSLRRR